MCGVRVRAPRAGGGVMEFGNTLLKRLSAQVLSRLSLRRIDFELYHEIEYPGKIIDMLVFVETGMASMTISFADGAQVEAGMFGYESVVGVSALMGTRRALNRVYTQVPGYGYACTVEAGLREFKLGLQFQALTLRYVQAQLVQAIQSTGCNARHTAEQRLARWLLICADRVQSSTLPLSQDLLAQMLGSTRSTVSIAAGVLKGEGLIDYTRGVVEVLDADGLRRKSCECYQVIRDHLESYADLDINSLS